MKSLFVLLLVITCAFAQNGDNRAYNTKERKAGPRSIIKEKLRNSPTAQASIDQLENYIRSGQYAHMPYDSLPKTDDYPTLNKEIQKIELMPESKSEHPQQIKNVNAAKTSSIILALHKRTTKQDDKKSPKTVRPKSVDEKPDDLKKIFTSGTAQPEPKFEDLTIGSALFIAFLLLGLAAAVLVPGFMIGYGIYNNAIELRNGSMSEDSDENEEGQYTVFECPGLATTGEMEVRNPLFNETTPAPVFLQVVQPQLKE